MKTKVTLEELARIIYDEYLLHLSDTERKQIFVKLHEYIYKDKFI